MHGKAYAPGPRQPAPAVPAPAVPGGAFPAPEAGGAFTNRFGETMVYDSSGNLAPAPRATPVEPGIAPVVGGEVPGGAFPVVPIAGGAFPGAEVPGEAFPVAPVAPVVVPQPTGIDKVLVEKYGYEFVRWKSLCSR